MTKERISGALSPNYQAPVIKVVSFKVEEGFYSPTKIGTPSTDPDGSQVYDNETTTWNVTEHF